MGNFLFKKFAVRQIHSAMKVNTDGVLVGVWANIEDCRGSNYFRVLDIGTGTGIISLIIAQRVYELCSFSIKAVEIDKASADEAEENFLNSPWSRSINIFKGPLSDFVKISSEKFDLIISNPPYFIKSLKTDSARRSLAKHCDNSLPFEELAQSSAQLISTAGKLVIILPIEECDIFSQIAKVSGLFLTKKCFVQTTALKPPKRVLAEYKKTEPLSVVEEALIIQDKLPGEFTEEYKNLTKEFYLRF